MIPIFKIENPISEISKLQIYEHVFNDSDEMIFPVIVNGRYYHFKKEDDEWYAIGLSDELILFISMVIDRYILEKNGSLNIQDTLNKSVA